jgi:integrase
VVQDVVPTVVQRVVQAQFSIPPYVVRWRDRSWRYRRRVPTALRELVGVSVISTALVGDPGTRRFQADYNRAHGEAEQRIAAARAATPRELTPHQRLGVAGTWAQRIGWSDPDPVGPEEAGAVLSCLVALDLTLPSPLPLDWRPPVGACDLDSVQRLVGQLYGLTHPGQVDPWLIDHQGDAVIVRDQPHAADLLTQIVRQAKPGLDHWIGQARDQLQRLGVTVAPTELQAVALRLTTTACHLSEQVVAIQQGQIPTPLQFPDPPAPDHTTATLDLAMARWVSLRSPTSKTQLDAQARLTELAAHASTNRLEDITAEHISTWRDALLQTATPATVKRRLALIRAVLKAAASDGLPVDAAVLERLGTPIAGSSGTTRQRRPFTNTEASALWQISRTQTGRPLDRWALPLGLSIGARLEEIAGLRSDDIQQRDGLWVVVIEPHEHRRLKNNNSTRVIPLPDALIAEGFTTWAQQQTGPLLFPEPSPPAADPRRSHYASIRLGKLIRHQARITDPTAVFHSCRHTAAQALVDAGCQQRLIEQLLGHTTRSMTARYSRGGLPLDQLAAAQQSRDWSWVPPLPEQDAITAAA